MTIRPLVIGLTGPFGSGCTTAANLLKDREGFRVAKPSEIIRSRWSEAHPEKEPARSDLQNLGNELREQAQDPGALTAEAIKKLGPIEENDRIVVDGIRNLGEVEYLRDRFGSGFFLFAMETAPSERWNRLKHLYPEGIERFGKDDDRDRDEEQKFGQQVQLCVDQADVIIVNSDKTGVAVLRDRLPNFVDLVTGKSPRYATPDEIFMNLAYSASHGSKCLKRQVGAVIVGAPPGEMGDILGQGFNENPAPTKPCVEEPAYGANPAAQKRGRCFRDIVRLESFTSFVADGLKCPICGTALQLPATGQSQWKCGKCGRDFERYFWPERAMTLCTAIHAEVAALFNAGRRAKDATLYTTTLPCFQCTEKIILAGIKSIVFNEPYPDIRAAERLTLAGIGIERFDGVRSRRFDEIFSRARR